VNLSQLTENDAFEIAVGRLTLLSVGLALVLYMPNNSTEAQNIIYVFDLVGRCCVTI